MHRLTARHCERSEAIQAGKKLDCFGAARLAMTERYRHRFNLNHLA
jgi:hypothetical protein